MKSNHSCIRSGRESGRSSTTGKVETISETRREGEGLLVQP